MQGHGEGSRRAWEALLNRAENVPEPIVGKNLPEEVIPKPTPSQEEIVAKGVADGFERYLIEKDKGNKKENKKTVKNGNGGRGETWGQYLIKEIKALGAQDVMFDEKKDKKVKFSYPDRKGRLQNRLLYLDEVADFIQKQQAKRERVSIEKPSLINEDSVAGQISAPVLEVDVTEAKNPFSISGDLKKSDQSVDVAPQVRESRIEQNVLDDMGIESIQEPQSNTGFGLAEVDEFETSVLLSDKKLYDAEGIAESLENERAVASALDEERKVDIQKKLESDLTVKWFDKEAFEFPERYDAVWNRFVATHPEKAVLYREHNPGIRSALERKEAEVEVPKKESKLEKQKSFDIRFETEFGITEEQLSQIEGYERLSEGQQKLVFENVREYARDTRGGFLSRAWEGILKKTTSLAEDGEKYKHVVAELIKNTAQFGPKVHEENGELFTDFIDVGIPQQFRKEHKPIFDRFNALAHQYAKMKVEDLEDGIGTHSKDESKFVSFFKNTFSESRRKHDAYESLQESYESAKRALAESLTEMGKSEGEIAEKLVQIDSKVHSLRFLQTEPEAVQVIKENPDKSFWQKVGEKVFSKENMTYAGLGFVGRMALTGAMGLYAAPVVASAIGGVRSWNKTAAEFRERDRMTREGTAVKDPRTKAIQVKINDLSTEWIKLGESPSMDDRVKRIEIGKRINDLMEIVGTDLNVVDAARTIEIEGKEVQSGTMQKLKDLIEKYKVVEGGEEAIEKKKAIIESMRARVQYTEDKIKLNRINFGSGALRSVNMADLFEVLGEARILLADIDMPKESVLEARLEQYLVKQEGLIQTRRRKKQIKTAVWGTLKAGAFALAGRELAEYGKETGFFDKVTSGVSGLFGENSSSPQGDEIPTKPKVGYGSDQAIESSKPGSVVQETQARGAVPENAPKIQKSAPHTIKAGDTLTKILKEQAPSIKELGNTQAQENAVANILRSLTPNEMDSLGLRSHNIENIRVDDSIDVEKLNAIIADKQSIIESAQNRFGGEPVRSYTEASPRSGSQQGEIVKDAGGSLKAGEAITSGKGAGEDGLPEKPSTGAEPVASDVGTSQNSSLESAPHVDVAPQQDLSEYESLKDSFGTKDEVDTVVPDQPQQTIEGVSINKHGVPIDETRPNVYKVKTIGGKEILISHGGGDLKSRVDEAYKYAEKNPSTTVYVEGVSKVKSFGPPPMIAVTAPTGVVKDVDLNIMGFEMDRTFAGDIDTNSFTERLTKR